MIFRRDAQFERSARIVLVLYAGAFLGQAHCVLHSSHMESGMEAGMEGSAPHVSASMATHALPPPAAHALFSMVAHSSSEHGGHSDATGQIHGGACAVVACGSAITANPDHGLGPMSGVSNTSVAYLGGIAPPDAEMVPPPPRLG